MFESILTTLSRDFRLAWRAMLAWLRTHAVGAAISLVLLLAVVIFVTFPNDLAWFKAIRGDKDEGVRDIAQTIGWWGNAAQYNLAVVVGIWLTGKVRRSRALQRLAIVVVLTTTAAGLICNSFRFTLGRPRPYTNEDPSQFHGPGINWKYNGFPSGHTSTAFGTAIPVLVTVPQVGVPITIFAGLTAWARIYDKQHYPSDVLVGAYLGILCGLAGGLPLRRAMVRQRRRELDLEARSEANEPMDGRVAGAASDGRGAVSKG